jgi:hypothetical protein
VKASIRAQVSEAIQGQVQWVTTWRSSQVESPEELPEVSEDASPDATDEGGSCSPSATVHLEDGTNISMHELSAGAHVKVGLNMLSS